MKNQSSEICLGMHWSYNFRNDPKRLPFVLARYAFAQKMISNKKSVLELGCSDGIGATILAENKELYVGVDLDQESLNAAKKNFKEDSTYQFQFDDFMGKTYGEFDSVVSLDVIEHIIRDYEHQFFDTIVKNISKSGVVILGTPNITAAPYASEASNLGHVNLYSQERLLNKMKEYFHHVFPFGMNDEVVHTGYASMCHYILCVACHKKEKKG